MSKEIKSVAMNVSANLKTATRDAAAATTNRKSVNANNRRNAPNEVRRALENGRQSVLRFVALQVHQSPSNYPVKLGIAVLFTAAALIAKILLQPLFGEANPFLIFFSSILISAWLGGLIAGLLATLLAAFASDFFFIAPVYSLRLADANEFWHLLLFIAEGAAVSFGFERLRFSQTLTEQQQSALAEAEERYRIFVRQSSEAIWRVDLDAPLDTTLDEDAQVDFFFNNSFIAECNDAMAQMYGYERAEELKGMRINLFIPPRDKRNVEYVRSFVRSNYAIGDAESIEIDRRGSSKFFTNNLTGIINGKYLYRIWGTRRDVTASKQAENASRLLAEASDVLASSLKYEETIRQVMRRLVPQLADWCSVRIKRDDGGWHLLAIEFANAEQAELARRIKTHVEAQTAQGFKSNDNITTNNSRCDSDALKSSGIINNRSILQLVSEVTDEHLRAVAADTVELHLLREINMRSYISAPLRASGKTLGVIAVATAESGRKYTSSDLALIENLAHRIASAIENAQLLDRAQSANRTKDEFLATLSHELRTPLTPIIGWLNMMRTRALPLSDMERGLSAINRNALWLARLINDLLDMSAILSGKIKLDKTDVPLAEAIQEAIETVAEQAAARAITIDFTLCPNLEHAVTHGDRTRLVQIFWNLLTNAIKFSDDDARIEVSCEITDETSRVRIKDFGIGIEPEFLPHIFERFRQADSSATRSFGGMGIGLALVKSFAEAHGGSVHASSEGIKRGTQFTVALPLVVPIQKTHNMKEELSYTMNNNSTAHAQSHGTRVLIVDDMTDTLEMMQMMFRRAGYEPTICEDAFEALRYASTAEFDVIVADIGSTLR